MVIKTVDTGIPIPFGNRLRVLNKEIIERQIGVVNIHLVTRVIDGFFWEPDQIPNHPRDDIGICV